MLVYERRTKTPLVVLEGDSTTSPRTQRPYEEIVRTMPDSVLQSVLKENEKFGFDRAVYSSDFFKFLDSLLQAALPIENLTQLGTRFVLDVMTHAQDNRLLPEVTATLKRFYTKYPQECVHLFTAIEADNMRNILDLLLVCTEKTTRSCISDLLSHCLNLLFTPESSQIALAKGLVTALLQLIPRELHKHWVRFQQFWELFRDFAAGGDLQARFLIENGAIATLLDFYLGNKSPILKGGEKRPVMGNKMWGPVYDGLVQTISILSEYVGKEGGFELDSDSLKCISDGEFVDKTLRGGYDGKALGKVIGKWGQNNLSYSQAVAEIILKVLNDIEYEEARGLFDAIEAYITIQDDYQQIRIEWLMGFPTPLRSNREYIVFPDYGSALASWIDEEVWSFPTPLCCSHSDYDSPDSILTLIWKHRKRWDQYCVSCVKTLFSICLRSPALSKYMEKMPAVTYQYSSYVAWIREFLVGFAEYQVAWGSAARSKKEDSLPEATRLCREFQLATSSPLPFPYILGKTTDAKDYATVEYLSDVVMTVWEYTTFWGESKPNGRTNEALPGFKLKSEVASKGFTSIRPTQLNIETGVKTIINFATGEVEKRAYVKSPEEQEESKSSLEQEAATVLRFFVRTLTGDPQRLTLTFTPDPAGNYLCPTAPITVILPGASSKDICTLCKLDPALAWGPLRYDLQQEIAQTFASKEGEEFKEVVGGYYPMDEGVLPISDPGSGDDEPKAAGGVIACPECTLHNPASALKCEACGRYFKSFT